GRIGEPRPIVDVLVTAFEPFDGRARNRSLDAVRLLAARGLPTETLPVDFARLPALVPPLVERARRALVLVGESTRARRPTLERTALNAAAARPADNAGAQPRDAEVVPGGPLALAARWPGAALARALRDAGHPVDVSFHAGTYACNAALYLALHHAARLP